MIEPNNPKSEQEIKDTQEVKSGPSKKSAVQNAPMPVLIAAGLIIALCLIQVYKHPENKSFFIIIIITIVILILLGKQTSSEHFLTPEEAETDIKLEMIRKVKEGQLPLGTKWNIAFANPLRSRQGSGIDYWCGVEVSYPYQRSKEYWICRVPGEGKTRGYPTFFQSLGYYDGRYVKDEKTLLDPLFKAARGDDFMKSIYLRGMGRGGMI